MKYPKTYAVRAAVWRVYCNSINIFFKNETDMALERRVVNKAIQRGRLFDKVVINDKLVKEMK